MTARTALAPRTNLVPCGHKPVHHAVINAPALIADFGALLRKHGVEPGGMSTQATADAEALVVLAATMAGAQAEMPQSLHKRYEVMLGRVGAESVEADRWVA